MFEENDHSFEEKDREEMVHRYEDLLRKKKPLFFDVDDFESIIDFYLDQNKVNNALEATRIAAGLFPTSPEIMVRKAQLLLDKGKPIEAMIELKKALMHDSDNFEIYLLLGIASTNIGNLKEAVKYFDESTSKIDEGIRKDEVLFSIGFHLGHANKYTWAIKYLQQSLELNPENLDALAEMAYCYDGLANYDKSIEFYNKCIDIDAFSEYNWYNLGLIYNKIDKFEKAIESFDYALAIDPSNLSALIAKANLYLNQENYSEAIKVYEEYLNYDSEYIDAYYYIGECYEKIEKYDQAVKYYELTVANNDNHVEAWLGMGVIKLFLEDYKKGLICLTKAVNLDPKNPEARYSLAELYLKTGVYEEGLLHIVKAIEIVPEEVDYILLESELYYALNQFEKSISELEKKYMVVTEKAPALYRLAGLNLTHSSSTRAIDFLRMAVELDSSLIYEFLRIFPEAKNFEGFKLLLNLPE